MGEGGRYEQARVRPGGTGLGGIGARSTNTRTRAFLDARLCGTYISYTSYHNHFKFTFGTSGYGVVCSVALLFLQLLFAAPCEQLASQRLKQNRRPCGGRSAELVFP